MKEKNNQFIKKICILFPSKEGGFHQMKLFETNDCNILIIKKKSSLISLVVFFLNEETY